MREFFAMGGYAVWVWTAYGLTALVMMVNILAARSRLRNVSTRVSRSRRASGREQG